MKIISKCKFYFIWSGVGYQNLNVEVWNPIGEVYSIRPNEVIIKSCTILLTPDPKTKFQTTNFSTNQVVFDEKDDSK